MKKVHLVSLGCPKNLVDSEMMLGGLLKSGYEVVQEATEAETVIVNTCGFIEDSKKESIEKILEMGELKKKNLKNLVVAGCLTQRYKDSLVDELPEADLFVGSGEFQNISRILDDHEKGVGKKTYFHLPTFLQEDETPRINSQPKHRAYLKISEGCMKRCSFCAIPLIRGNLQSRTIRSVVAEAQRLVKHGTKEIIVVSHDFTDYGRDLKLKNPQAKESPVELLKALVAVEDLPWIRLMYLYPDGISEEVLDVMAQSQGKIVPYFDMPLQHINDEMLKGMNRHMTRKEIETALRMIRDRIPHAVIRTQFIVGFPGETEEAFEELLQFLVEQRFDRVGCFEYSPEENTPGGKRKDQIPTKTKRRRFNELMKIQREISYEKNQALVGKTFDVLVEGLSEETDLLLQGRTPFQAPDIDGVVLINDGQAQVGEIVKVHVTEAHDYDLVGSVIHELH